MQINVNTPEEYIQQIPDERKEAFTKLRETILNNLPEGFTETMSYGMLSYVIPHSIYPAGYHCDPKQALPFLSIASQKNFIAFYHNGIYASKELHDWFINEYPKHSKTKLDMGKSCIRFKKIDQIPYKLIGDLLSKMTSEEFIKIYETNIKR